MNKKEIAQLFIFKLEDQILKQKKVLDETRSLANDSPSANESHSDTSKFQLGNLALAQESRVRELENTLEKLRSIIFSPNDKITIGAIFILDCTDKKIRHYFVFDGAQGINAEVEGITMTAISTESPIGVSAFGKKKGDSVSFSAFSGNIINVL